MTNRFSRKAFSLIELSIVVLVIGILIAGVIAGAKLFEKMSIVSARALTNSSPVSGIKNLVAWYETTSESSFPASVDPEDSTNNQVSTWYNLNPTQTLKCNLAAGSTAAPSLAVSPPTLVRKGIRNFPAVYFDGVSNYLSCDDISANFSNVNINLSIFLVMSFTSQTSTVVASFSQSISSSPLLRISNNNYYTNLTTAGGNNASLQTTNRRTLPNMPNLFAYTFNGSNVLAYVNGVYQETTDFSALGPLFFNQFSVGAITRGAPQSFFQGYVGELIIFDRALTAEETSAINKYLMQKWGIK